MIVMRASVSVSLLLVLTVCSCSHGLPKGSLADCQPSEALSVQGGVARLDRDGDGALTAADLRPGQVGAVLSWLRPAGQTGTSAHLSAASDRLFIDGGQTRDWEPIWGVQAPLHDCDPAAIVNVSLLQQDPNLTSLEPGVHELGGVGIYAPEFEVQPHNDEESVRVEGVIRITEAQQTASGHLEGAGEVDLAQLIPPPEQRTGQTVRVEAFAFRELEFLAH